MARRKTLDERTIHARISRRRQQVGWGSGAFLPLARALHRRNDVHEDQAATTPPVPFALGVVPWKQNEVLRVTVVVKATFLAKMPRMVPAATPLPYRISDVHYKNQPAARVIAAADRVPRKPRVDVTFLGHAHAMRGASVAEMFARVALKHEERVLFDKRLRIVGARIDAESAPIPFVRMPIVYERALGGIGTAENPIGCGEDDADDEDRPNILDPNDPSRPIGLGPVSVAWPVRKKKLGQTSPRDVESPLMSLPDAFDFSYFQSAPEDQQIDELPPNATLILEGFDPEREHVEIELPGARAMGAIYGLDAADPDLGTMIEFRADSLQIDADQWTATLTFRGDIEIHDPSRLDQVVVATGIGMGGVNPIIPAMRPPADRIKPATEVSPGVTNEANVGGTLMLGNDAPLAGPALPFASPPMVSPDQRKKRSSETLVLPLSAWSKGPTRHLSTQTLALAPNAPELAPAPVPTDAPAPAIAPGPLLISPPPLVPVMAFAEPDEKAQPHEPHPLASAQSVDDAPKKPEEIVDIERYGFVLALIDERASRRSEILKDQSIDPAIWRKAERHWRLLMKKEMAEGNKLHLERFEDAFVRGWESIYPARFSTEHYARLVIAEREARLVRELRALRIDPSLGMKLRRVWRRRIMRDDALRSEFEGLLAQGVST